MGFFDTLIQTFSIKPIDWDELEALMIRADLGVPVTMRIMNKLQEQEAWSATGIKNVVQIARKEIAAILPKTSTGLEVIPGKPRVILVVGVNGPGKTTSTAKLANYLKQRRHSVLLAAADTFRAAAIEQLGIWADRLGVEMIRGQYNADPAALCYEAYQSAVRRQAEFLICDTAGR
jgi:fused signal recognition particle receptor